MRRVIDLTEMLEDQDERRHEELVRQQLDWCSSWRSPRIAFSAGQWLPLLRSWWSSRLTSTTGPKSFSPPIQHSVFGLTTLQDFLLAFFLHQESKVGPKYSWQIHVLDQTRSPICEEAKLDLVLESASQEEKDEVLGKVKLKCWNVQAWHSGAVEYWPSPSGFHRWGKETKVSAGYQCCNCIQEAAMGFKLRLCVGKKETVRHAGPDQREVKLTKKNYQYFTTNIFSNENCDFFGIFGQKTGRAGPTILKFSMKKI